MIKLFDIKDVSEIESVSRMNAEYVLDCIAKAKDIIENEGLSYYLPHIFCIGKDELAVNLIFNNNCIDSNFKRQFDMKTVQSIVFAYLSNNKDGFQCFEDKNFMDYIESKCNELGQPLHKLDFSYFCFRII